MKKVILSAIILGATIFGAKAQLNKAGGDADNAALFTKTSNANIGAAELYEAGETGQKLYWGSAFAHYNVPFNTKFVALQQQHNGITVLNGFSQTYMQRSGTEKNSNLGWLAFAMDGDWKMLMNKNGQLHIGTTFSSQFKDGSISQTYKLFVQGGIRTEELKIDLAGSWADYVFKADYKLTPLSEVESFINTNGHLPNIPSGASVEAEGVNVNQMLTLQMEKIEELTLYMIQLKKENDALKTAIDELK